MSRLYVYFHFFKTSCSNREWGERRELINSLDGSCGLGKLKKRLNGQ